MHNPPRSFVIGAVSALLPRGGAVSKYMKIATQFKDEEMFRAALRAVCQERGIEVVEYREPIQLTGYLGDTRDEVAHYIISRKHIGSASNDLGFRREDGEIVAVISEFDTRRGGQVILNHVKREYARRMVTLMARRRGMEVEEIHENGVTRLRLRPKRARNDHRVRVRR